MSRSNRRRWLEGIAGAGMAGMLAAGSTPIPATPARRDLIRAENERAGTADWRLTRTRVDPKTRYRCPWIEGYCSRTSVRAGEALEILVSTDPPSPFVIEVYRLGYYGGKGGRHLARLGPFRGVVQPEASIGAERLRACRWEPATRLVIPEDWPSGVYLGKLTAEREGLQSYVVFIVRDDRPCDLLFQCSDTTWAAYNRWPSTWSLYDVEDTDHWYTGPGVSAGWDRPYGKYRQVVDAPLSLGSGEFLLWEFPLAFWLEKEGYARLLPFYSCHEAPTRQSVSAPENAGLPQSAAPKFRRTPVCTLGVLKDRGWTWTSQNLQNKRDTAFLSTNCFPKGQKSSLAKPASSRISSSVQSAFG